MTLPGLCQRLDTISLQNLICMSPWYSLLGSNFPSGCLARYLGMDEWLPHALVVNICPLQNFREGWEGGFSLAWTARDPSPHTVPHAFPCCRQFGLLHYKVRAMSASGVSEMLGKCSLIGTPAPVPLSPSKHAKHGGWRSEVSNL